jgi:hypothetical protein
MPCSFELTKLKLEAMHNAIRQLQEDLYTHPDLTANTADLLDNVLTDHSDLLDAEYPQGHLLDGER